MKTRRQFHLFRNFSLMFLLLMLFVLPVRASGSYTSVSVTGKQLYSEAYKALEQTNALRKKVGAEALTMDMDLLEAAMQRAAEISLYFSHTRPNETLCFTACDKIYGENIAMGSGAYTAAKVVNDWKNSSGHYANMVHSSYTTIGIGCVYRNGIYYWVQCFGYGEAKTGTKPSNSTKTFTVQVSSSVADSLGLRTVVFNANGGSFSKTSSVTTKETTLFNGKKYGTLPTVYRTGYKFKGWYTAKTGGSKVTAAKTVSISSGNTQTLYARWEKISTGKATISKFVKKGSGAKVTWKKVSGAVGYEVSISSSKSFPASGTTTKTSLTRSARFYSLKKGTWYCRVRAYKTDSTGNRVYGAYSAVKKLTLK